jgi:hypothetical protein
MRKQSYILLLVILLSDLSLQAQHAALGFRLEFGSYEMQSLKDFQKFRKSQYDLPLKTVVNFPVSPIYRVEISNLSDQFISRVGFYYAFHSTGGRAGIADYSGSFNLDAIVNGHQMGLCLENLVHVRNGTGFGFYSEVGYLRSVLKIRDKLVLQSPNPHSESESYTFISNGTTAEPGIFGQLQYRHFHVKITLGVLIPVTQGFYLKGERKAKLYSDDAPVKPGWTGFRAGLQIDLTRFKSADR